MSKVNYKNRENLIIEMASKKTHIGLALVAVVLIGFYFLNSGGAGSGSVVESQIAGNWINMELKDVTTGETFTIKELSDSGKPVLLESFAVWCPTCTRQQKITKEFEKTDFGSEVISVSIDTDPNEDEARIREHAERNGFTWFYAVSPEALTRSLIDQFGVSIVNAPSVPMILVCDSQNVRKLGSGIKSVNELTEEVSRGC